MNKILQKIIDNSYLKAIFYFVLSLVFVLSAVFLSNKITGNDKGNGSDKLTNRSIVTCPSDFISYQELSKDPQNIVSLISERTPMYAENGQFHSKIVVTKIETEKSKVACGYLFVKAGTKTYGPIQKWENLYINPNGFGGHINSINNIGLGDSSDSSEYLFPLSKMSYWPTRDKRTNNDLLSADWGVLLNVSPTIDFEIGLNTNDKTGFIDQFSIAYKCWNPETGEENHDCKIEVVK